MCLSRVGMWPWGNAGLLPAAASHYPAVSPVLIPPGPRPQVVAMITELPETRIPYTQPCRRTEGTSCSRALRRTPAWCWSRWWWVQQRASVRVLASYSACASGAGSDRERVQHTVLACSRRPASVWAADQSRRTVMYGAVVFLVRYGALCCCRVTCHMPRAAGRVLQLPLPHAR